MSFPTPELGIQVPSPATKLKDLGSELVAMGLSIEETLLSFDYNGADPNLVLARVATLESELSAAEAQITALEAATADTGWHTLTLNPGFTLTSPSHPLRIRRIGNTGFVWGGVAGPLYTAVASFPSWFGNSAATFEVEVPGTTDTTSCRIRVFGGTFNLRTNNMGAQSMFQVPLQP